MQSIQVGITMVAEILYAMMKNIGSTRSKGVDVKIVPQCTIFHETLASCKILGLWVLWLLSSASSTRGRI